MSTIPTAKLLPTGATTHDARNKAAHSWSMPAINWLALRKVLLPIAVLVAALVGWESLYRAGSVSPLILAPPSDILAAYPRIWPELLANAGLTLTQALTGFVIGNFLGLLVAVAFVHMPRVRSAAFPLAVVAEAIPMVAVIPVLILWLGNGMAPKVVITAFLSFFPMLINAMRGLRSSDAELRELLHTLSASRLQVLMLVRLPASIPYLFNALRLTATASLMAAIAAEWLAANTGLGHLITFYGMSYRTPEVWATAFAATAMSLTIYGAVALAERLAQPWRRSGTR